MTRVTVENSADRINDRFELVVVAAQRAKELSNGTPALVEVKMKDGKKEDKDTVIALSEVEEGKLSIAKVKEDVIRGFRHHVVLNDVDDDNKELEFIEKEITGDVVFSDENSELSNVSEEELNAAEV